MDHTAWQQVLGAIIAGLVIWAGKRADKMITDIKTKLETVAENVSRHDTQIKTLEDNQTETTRTLRKVADDISEVKAGISYIKGQIDRAFSSDGLRRH